MVSCNGAWSSLRETLSPELLQRGVGDTATLLESVEVKEHAYCTSELRKGGQALYQASHRSCPWPMLLTLSAVSRP